MSTINKKHTAYKTIGEVAKELDLVNKKTGHLQTHTIRYWETQFKQIRPIIRAGKRRYYSLKDLEVIKYIKFLLKEKGLTINGVKKMLNDGQSYTIDDSINLNVYKPGLKTTKVIKERIKNISKIIKELKNLKPDSSFNYYVKKPSSGEKAKVKLKVKKYNPATRKHEVFIEKKLPPHSK